MAVNSNCYHGFTIDEAIEGITKAGFRYIELTATKGWTEHVFPNHSFEELQRVKDKLNSYQLVPVGMSGHCNLMDNNRLPDFIKNIHLAHFFGCKYIVSSIGEAHLEDERHLGNKEVSDNIKSLVPLLQSYDMMLVLEVHGDHGSGEIIDKIVKYVNSEYVRIAYDTANAIFYGGVNVVEDMSKCMNHISYVHLKDKAGEQKEWNFPYLGAGYVNFKDIFKLLEEKKNGSPFSIEIEFTQDGPKDLDEVNEAVQKSMEYLKEMGQIEGGE